MLAIAAMMNDNYLEEPVYPCGSCRQALLESENRLLEPRNWDKCTLFDINFRPSDMSGRELDAGFKRLAVELYSDEFTAWRRGRFKNAIKNQRRAKGAKS